MVISATGLSFCFISSLILLFTHFDWLVPIIRGVLPFAAWVGVGGLLMFCIIVPALSD